MNLRFGRSALSHKKIVRAACRIRAGSQSAVKLGNLAIQRDWGWAPEYVEAMWRILQHPKADDFVIATGSAYSLADFTAAAFGELGLDWRDHVELDTTCNGHPTSCAAKAMQEKRMLS